jgi:hypothetical protein
VVIFFACLDLEQKSSFMDGHLLELILMQNFQNTTIQRRIVGLKKQHGAAGKQAGDKRKMRQAYAAVFLGRQKHTQCL